MKVCVCVGGAFTWAAAEVFDLVSLVPDVSTFDVPHDVQASASTAPLPSACTASGCRLPASRGMMGGRVCSMLASHWTPIAVPTYACLIRTAGSLVGPQAAPVQR